MQDFVTLLNNNQGVLALISIIISFSGFTGLTVSINKSNTTKGDNSPVQSNNGNDGLNVGKDFNFNSKSKKKK